MAIRKFFTRDDAGLLKYLSSINVNCTEFLRRSWPEENSDQRGSGRYADRTESGSPAAFPTRASEFFII